MTKACRGAGPLENEMVEAELLIDMIRGNTVQSAVLSWDLTVRISC